LKRAFFALVAVLLAACAVREPSPLPPVGRDHQGLRPAGGANYALMRDGAVFNQHDPRWGEIELGQSGESIGAIGCTMTSVAMAAVNLGETTDPGRLNYYLSTQNGYTETGLLKWDSIRRASNGRLIADYFDTPAYADIDRCLRDQAGYPLVQFLLGGRVQHWALIVGKEGETFFIRDPLYITREPIPLQFRAPSIRAVRCVRKAG
jgi:hypothetical protein